MLYALGVFNDFHFMYQIEQFTVHIVQPRKNNISEWTISTEDLLVWADDIKKKAELALTPSAPRVPGDKQCQWCKAKATCKALHDFTEETITGAFDDLSNINILTDLQLRTIVDNQKLIETFIKSVEAEVFARLEIGTPFPGYKLVEGRSTRQWTGDAQDLLEAELGDDAYTKKLIGITAAQKLLGAGFVDDNTVKPQGRPTLAQETDKRIEINCIQFDKM